jgi:acyl carrier protein
MSDQMSDPTSQVTAILRKYMRDPNTVVAAALTLTALEIDLLDLPLIYLDIEDAFDIDVGQGDGLEQPATVGQLIARVAERLAARAAPRPRLPRRKSTWLSTGAERQR